MNRILEGYVVALMMVAMPGAVFAQSGATVPLQRGVSVQMPVTSNAVAIPNADQEGTLVVALTADGNVYLNAERLSTAALADRITTMFSTRTEKTLYVKADARVPFARVIEVIDAVRTSGVDGLTFLTAQQDAADQGQRPVPPNGLEMRIVQSAAAPQGN
jgi:biopolymer transport protein ExbD